MIHTTEEEKDGEGKEEKRRGKRKWQKGGRATAGASAIKTPEEGSDLRVIALLSTTHSRAIYSRRVQAD